jgi:uncharacterized membrane protein
MVEHSEEIEIDRPVDDVYSFLVDASNDTRWRKEVVRSELVSGEAGQAGARYRQVMKPGRKESVGTHEIVAVNPPSLIEWRTPPGEGPLDFSGWYRVEPYNAGCRVTIHAEVTPHGLFRLAKPFMSRFLRKVSAQYAGDLKATLEQPKH